GAAARRVVGAVRSAFPGPGAGRARTGGYHRVTQRGSVRPATSRGPTVNMYLRLLLFMIRVRVASRLSICDSSHTASRVNLADLDVQRHMNNGRFLSIMDLGRMDLMLRSRFWDRISRQGWYPVVAGQTITYRKP